MLCKKGAVCGTAPFSVYSLFSLDYLKIYSRCYLVSKDVEQSEYRKADKICNKQQRTVGKTEHFDGFQNYRESECKMYSRKDKRSKEHGQHL